VISMNRQLAMAAIHKHGKLHSARTAEIHKFVERGAYRAARIENVVDEDDGLPFDAFRNLGPLHDRLYVYGRKIVSIERNVDSAHGGRLALSPLFFVVYAMAKRDASQTNAEKHHLRRPPIAFYDLGSQTRKRAVDPRRIHQLKLLYKIHLLSPLT